MSEQLIANIQYCSAIVSDLKSLLLYTHIPAAAITLFFSLFVFLKNKKSLLARILFAIGCSFAVWVTLNLLIWLRFDNAAIVMAAWAPIEAVKVFIFFLCWYFTYVFTRDTDLPRWQKIGWGVLLSGIFAVSVTTLNLSSYNLPECIAVEHSFYSTLTFWTEVAIGVLLLVYIGIKFVTRKKGESRQKVLFLGIGVIAFVLSFFIMGQISEATQNYTYEAVGLFGMVVFMGAMSYLILRYSLFSIKIFATQLLAIILILVTASQITFARGYGVILTGISVILSIVFSYFLIKSVRREITQRRQLEQLSQRLEETNLNLEVANTKLQSLDKLKTEFLSLASHQLRSPLTAIKGYASMLIEGSYGKLTLKNEEPIKRIYTSAQGLSNIVEDLLNVSKIEQGGMKYEFMPTDLSVVVTNLFNEMQIPAQSKNITLTLEMQKYDEFMTAADPTKIKQVFLNLVDNSIKYTPEGGTVTISLGRDTDKIVFAVTDNGMGISPETKAKLFEKFSRGEGGKINTGGSGLGLYLAKQIAIAHKGNIDIQSDGLGKGSTFKVTLPATGAKVTKDSMPV